MKYVRHLFVCVALLLIGCEKMPDARLKDLASFDHQDQRDGLIHGNSNKVLPPTPDDDAKIAIHADGITLAKAHVLAIKSERYQPMFRLEGVIIPFKQQTISLPFDAKFSHTHVKTGDMVKKGDTLATFYQEIVTPITPDDEKYPQQTPFPLVEKKSLPLITSMTGQVQAIFINDKHTHHATGSPFAVVIDDSQLAFHSPLPKTFEPYIQIGDAVQFDTEDGRTFSGQIQDMTPDPKLADTHDIHVAIKPAESTKIHLRIGERVGGYVNYGQMDVGVLVPDFAIMDDTLNPMDLSAINTPPYKPATPIKAWLWVIGQDEKLSLSPIFVIEYKPAQNQYLISGIALDGLIVLAKLPKHADGKRVRLR